MRAAGTFPAALLLLGSQRRSGRLSEASTKVGRLH